MGGPFFPWLLRMTRKTAAPRNQELIPGVPRYSRSAMFGKRGKFAKKPTEWKSPAKKQEAAPTSVVKDFNGGKRTVTEKAPRWYAAEDAPSRRAVRKAAPRQTKLRESITPGTVLIVLAGRFAGKRVVFLKQLESGLLLVTVPSRLMVSPSAVSTNLTLSPPPLRSILLVSPSLKRST